MAVIDKIVLHSLPHLDISCDLPRYSQRVCLFFPYVRVEVDIWVKLLGLLEESDRVEVYLELSITCRSPGRTAPVWGLRPGDRYKIGVRPPYNSSSWLPMHDLATFSISLLARRGLKPRRHQAGARFRGLIKTHWKHYR
ncbi:MAG: hypothetical protein GDA43_17905 [Hormoscilla sp. SP5CHS1]|nr:hypothetical protein [Hormoscilla sp. SP12CHS1]MBC6454840.1 hypothetical protein [Hormoscilla sp. SP5CHS1]